MNAWKYGQKYSFFIKLFFSWNRYFKNYHPAFRTYNLTKTAHSVAFWRRNCKNYHLVLKIYTSLDRTELLYRKNVISMKSHVLSILNSNFPLYFAFRCTLILLVLRIYTLVTIAHSFAFWRGNCKNYHIVLKIYTFLEKTEFLYRERT